MAEPLPVHAYGLSTDWFSEFANLIRHAVVRGERVYAYINGVKSAQEIVEAKATKWHLELTDIEGTNWLIAHPGGVVLRWIRTEGDD